MTEIEEVFIHVLLNQPIVQTEYIPDLAVQEVILIILIVTVLVVVGIIHINSRQVLPLLEVMEVVAIVQVAAEVLAIVVELEVTVAAEHVEDKC